MSFNPPLIYKYYYMVGGFSEISENFVLDGGAGQPDRVNLNTQVVIGLTALI